MANLTLINGDAENHGCASDLMLTDPPFDMPGSDLRRIIDHYDVNHLVLITTMRQFIGFISDGQWTLNFDFVLDAVAPKKSMSNHTPNYTHQTGVYMTRKNAASVFDRKARARSDTFDGNGYWPTIIRAPRQSGGYGKSEAAITDLLGSFRAGSVVDPFAGRGTVANAAFELDIDCTLIEKERAKCDSICQTFTFLGGSLNYLED